MLSEPSKDSSKLASIADELIRAAYAEAESTSVAIIGKEALEGLKKLSLNSSLVQKSIESLKSSLDSQMNTLNQSIVDLKEEIALQTKNQTLEWAIGYIRKYSISDSTSNGILQILFSFRRGDGHPVRYLHFHDKEMRKTFRDDLIQQIHRFTGRMPQIEDIDHDGFTIYYS